MQIFGFEITRKQALSPVHSGGWRSLLRISEPYAGAWQRNVEWSADTVLAHHAVYACVTLIAADIGKLRIKLVEQQGGIWRETTSPAFSPVLRKPNTYQNRIQFVEWWITSKLLRGNAYALKERDQRGAVTRLHLLDPNRVQVLVSDSGDVFYRLKEDNLAGIKQEGGVVVPAREIIHDRMNCLHHPLVGTSPIFACGMAANMGLKAEEGSARFFGNNSTPSGILSSPEKIPPDKAREYSEAWEANFGAGGRGGVAVLGFGMKYEPMRMTNTDAQMIEHLKWSAETVASAFHVPPFKIGVGQMPTYQNGELLDQRYYSDCLQSLIESLELCLDEGLGLDAPKDGKQLGVELDLEGLLRMDTASQVKTLTEGIRGGLWAPNEARGKVDAPPLEGGDTIYLQHQDYPMEKVYNRTDLDAAPPAEPAPTLPESEGTDERSIELIARAIAAENFGRAA